MNVRIEMDNTADTPMLFRNVKSPLPKRLVPSEPMLVHAQNVRDYFVLHHKEHNWENLGSFTCVRPPFPQLLITYDHLFTIHPNGEKVHNLRRMGVTITERTPEYFQYYLKPEANPTDYDPKLVEAGRRELLDLVENAHPTLFLEMTVSVDARLMPGRWFVMLDALGAVIVHGPFGYIIINSPEERSYLAEIGLPETTHEDFVTKHGTIALATLQFMNCKNVEIIENPPTRQQRRLAEREGKRVPVTYKTLVIHPVGKRRFKNIGGNPAIYAEAALHICRGHFKSYAEGKGLGKYHTHGLWWWSPQVRGSLERGRVVKDYDVEVKA